MNGVLTRLNIELSAHCNYACESCPNTYMTREKGHMDPGLFKRIVDEVDGRISKMYLWNYGEPLLNPHAPKMLEGLSRRSFRSILSTTGYMLSALEDVSFLAELDEFIISINGFTPEVYAFHQKRGDLERVISGLERVKDTMEEAQTEYVLQTVVNKRNLEQIDMIKEFMIRFGFDRADLKSFNVMDNRQETFERFVPEDPRFNRYGVERRSDRPDPCQNWMVINWNGDVNPCCWDYTGSYVLGNVDREGVFGVWDSIRSQDHRKRMEAADYYPICANCGRDGTLIERVEAQS
ncbi:MAG: radical SAM/SPASM domain-containing protein [Candidatus Woesearchaeota archaeon]